MLICRSTDGGKAWCEALAVWGDDDTYGNPAPVVDQDTGVIWLPVTWNLCSDHEHETMAASSQEVGHAVHSDDHGLTCPMSKKISQPDRQPHCRCYAKRSENAIQPTHAPRAAFTDSSQSLRAFGPREASVSKPLYWGDRWCVCVGYPANHGDEGRRECMWAPKTPSTGRRLAQRHGIGCTVSGGCTASSEEQRSADFGLSRLRGLTTTVAGAVRRGID
jgi:hypothetical protein